MIGDIKTVYCPVCEAETEHKQGCFKCKEIDGKLFFLNTSVSESLDKISSGFKKHVIDENAGEMDKDTPAEYVGSVQGGLDFELLFAPVVRSMRCSCCDHLIQISKLP